MAVLLLFRTVLVTYQISQEISFLELIDSCFISMSRLDAREETDKTGFYPSRFVYSRFPPEIQFLFCLLSSVAAWVDPIVDNEGKIFHAFQFIFHGFFLEFQSFIGSFEEKLTRKIHTTYLYVRRIGE